MQVNTENVSQQSFYDIIIAGAGCAGLSLLYAILKSPSLNKQSILVIDKSFSKANDRTWCFWEEGHGIFENLVCKQWEQISIHKKSFSTTLPTDPFVYKMIQGEAFYSFVIQFAKKFKNVHWVEATIDLMENQKQQVKVGWETGNAIGNKVFSSVLSLDKLHKISQSNLGTPFLWQHFKGWLIQFDEPVFNETEARLMDFNVDQHQATAFMYQLPLTDQKALVEYTLFSKNILNASQYEAEIKSYLNYHFPNKNYQILHEEIGAIPMTSQSIAKTEGNIYVIGTLGNAVKASSGYAFQFIQNQVKQIIHQLESGQIIDTQVHNTRHFFYDAVLLYVLDKKLMEGSEIFKRIFEKNNAPTIFKFLSNTSNIWEDIKIMRSLPTNIFLPAAIKVLFRRS
jgi:lycopene beta-cyclase